MSKRMTIELSDMQEKILRDYIDGSPDLTVTDAVAHALYDLYGKKFDDPNKNRLFTRVYKAAKAMCGDANDWFDVVGMTRTEIKGLCERIESGKDVRGYGNNVKKMKYRDKKDGREFKTKTALVCHLIQVELNINVNDYLGSAP